MPRDFEEASGGHLEWTQDSRAGSRLDLLAAGPCRRTPELSILRVERAKPRARPRARTCALTAPPPRPATTDHSDRSRRATSRPSEERAGAKGGAGQLHRWVGRRGPRGCGASAEHTRPPLRPERRPPLCPSKTHARRLTSEGGNQKPGRWTSQIVGGTPSSFSLCFGAYLTGGRPPLKTQSVFNQQSS